MIAFDFQRVACADVTFPFPPTVQPASVEWVLMVFGRRVVIQYYGPLLTHNFAQLLRPAGEPRSLIHVTVVDGFEANDNKLRGLRIGIDASIWFFHAAHGREGENPELRTLFFRCARLLQMPFLPLFVFDGPKRPEMKRGKRITGASHWLTDGMKGIIDAFGFEWRMVCSLPKRHIVT